MGKWDYGEAGDLYPMRPGEAWTVGGHCFACADLEDGRMVESALSRMLRGRRVGLVYADPPWNGGNCTSFRTKANASTPSILKRKVDFGAFSHRLMALLAGQRCPVYVEGGVKERDQVLAAAEANGLVCEREWEIVYYRKHPCKLYKLVSPGAAPDGVDPQLEGMDDDDTPGAVMRAHGGGRVVFDPCTGRGLTARACVETGNVFVGTELNPRRLASAMASVGALVGETPARLRRGR